MNSSSTSSSTESTFQISLINLSATPAGFSASDVTGYAPEQVRRTAEALAKAGKIVRVKVSPRRVRYFANDKLATAYVAGSVAGSRARPVLGARSKATWSADEPGLITSSTKIHVAPPLPRRVFRTNTYQQF